MIVVVLTWIANNVHQNWLEENENRKWLRWGNFILSILQSLQHDCWNQLQVRWNMDITVTLGTALPGCYTLGDLLMQWTSNVLRRSWIFLADRYRPEIWFIQVTVNSGSTVLSIIAIAVNTCIWHWVHLKWYIRVGIIYPNNVMFAPSCTDVIALINISMLTQPIQVSSPVVCWRQYRAVEWTHETSSQHLWTQCIYWTLQ